MRTRMNYTPGFSASPERVMEFDMNEIAASQMLAAAERIRGLTAEFASKVAAEISANDLWCELPSLASAAAHTDASRGECLRELIDELIDEQLHQGKLEEAGEIA